MGNSESTQASEPFACVAGCCVSRQGQGYQSPRNMVPPRYPALSPRNMLPPRYPALSASQRKSPLTARDSQPQTARSVEFSDNLSARKVPQSARYSSLTERETCDSQRTVSTVDTARNLRVTPYVPPLDLGKHLRSKERSEMTRDQWRQATMAEVKRRRWARDEKQEEAEKYVNDESEPPEKVETPGKTTHFVAGEKTPSFGEPNSVRSILDAEDSDDAEAKVALHGLTAKLALEARTTRRLRFRQMEMEEEKKRGGAASAVRQQLAAEERRPSKGGRGSSKDLSSPGRRSDASDQSLSRKYAAESSDESRGTS